MVVTDFDPLFKVYWFTSILFSHFHERKTTVITSGLLPKAMKSFQKGFAFTEMNYPKVLKYWDT